MRVTAYMATYAKRRNILKRAVESICCQVDQLLLYVNDFTLVDDPAYKNLPANCHVIFGKDIGDVGKFYDCRYWNGYVFTCDDDIFYPANYVQKAITDLRTYEDKAVISYHGRILTPPVNSYFKAKQQYFPFYKTILQDVRVNQVGTGVMALHTDCLNKGLSLSIFQAYNMTDILFSAELNFQNIPMYVCSHRNGWLGQLPVTETVGQRQSRDDSRETAMVNSFNWPLTTAN